MFVPHVARKIRIIHSYSNKKTLELNCYSKPISGGFSKPLFSTSASLAVINKTLIQGVNLSWEKFGNGTHVALCFPGLAGSAAINFHPVVKKMNLEKFTIIAWDPPGYGKSRPPDRDVLTQQSLLTDAHLAGALMKELGYSKYSLVGFSAGGLTGALLAAAEPDKIRKLIMCNSPFMSCKCNTRLSRVTNVMEDLSTWEPSLRRETLDTYGKSYLMKMMGDWKKWVTQQSTSNDFNAFCSGELKKIQAPTLYIKSLKDVVVPIEDSSEYGKLIKNFKLHKVAKGRHNHLEFLDEFVTATENFLLCQDN